MDEDTQFSALLCEYVLLADALRVVKDKVAEEVLKRYPTVEEYDKVHRDIKALLRNALSPSDQQFLRDTDSGVNTGAEDKKRRKTIIHRINRWFNEIRIAVYQDVTIATNDDETAGASADNPIAGKSMFIPYYSDDDDYSEETDSNDGWEKGEFDSPVNVQVGKKKTEEDDPQPAVMESKPKRKSTKAPSRRNPKSPDSSVVSDVSAESFETLNNIDDFDEFVENVVDFALHKFNQKIEIVLCDDEDDENDGDEKVEASVIPPVSLQLPDVPVHSPIIDTLESRFKQKLS
jgi:hypothetical protein